MIEATLWLFGACLVLGSCVGLLAGLLGIGGGLLVVPALSVLLPWAGISASLVMPMALATSLASIVMTSASSAYTHYRLGNVQPAVVKTLLPGVLLGGLMGSAIADRLPTEYLPKVFGVIVLFLALQMALSLRVKPAKPLPGPARNVVSGGLIGMVASLAGIGGGSLTVPYLNYYGVEMRRAIGSASLCGVFLALSGMTGFIFFGLTQTETLPRFSVGYVYLPALIGIVGTSVFTTRYGARLASRLPTPTIKRVFAVFLLLVGASMFIS
ncbi:sulfite exporter TauE/SafE family protein [Enterovibrio makurazakiensis]|uniref:Probable membrane transporter protein n=1 Tax=Enterovibrio gelatinilyticus TaxID=2899819 RepID=A0ABT5R1I2_9GAMM|nr:sulfite exporter TauE/SafE family protein [Enterovibrio sp. ZSDZ42]MDD1794134.1 sulfite exporter TauE/SafE family protein [Enterovibrio sp. ZSDZ42]